MDSLNISETGLFLLLFKELLISPERSFAQISFSACLRQVFFLMKQRERERAHANEIRWHGIGGALQVKFPEFILNAACNILKL